MVGNGTLVDLNNLKSYYILDLETTLASAVDVKLQVSIVSPCKKSLCKYWIILECSCPRDSETFLTDLKDNV
jgi:hypothetical protein